MTSISTRLSLVRRDPTQPGPAEGQRIVLVHGSMDRASSFGRLMNRLADCSIVAYDRRGYAGSAATGPAEGFAQQVSDLVEVLGDDRALVFGHSYGGDVVLATAERHPELIQAALVWEPPQPWLIGWPSSDDAGDAGDASDAGDGISTPTPADRAESFMRRMVGDRVWERLPERTRAQRRAEGEALHAEIQSLAGPAPFNPAHVRIPVTVGRGGRSSTPHRRAARELAAVLPAGKLAEIHDAGHGAHLSHPAELAKLIRAAAARA
jgi:pimeloyl-ACP methyl ester carboxylesterase